MGPKPERRLTPPTPSWWERLVFGRIGPGALAMFCRQWAQYLEAGVDLVRSIQGLEKQFAGSALGPVLGRLKLSVRHGMDLTSALERERNVFDGFFLSMMRVAETRGGVPETLKELARHYEARQRMARQARSAMIYPVIVLIAASGVIAFLTIVLLPMFASMLRDLAGRGGADALPLPSRVLMTLSDFMGSVGWWLVPVILVGSVLGLVRMYRTRPGKAFLDRLAMRLPVLGRLLKLADSVRVTRSLSALLEAGVDVMESLRLTAGVVRLDPNRGALLAAIADVQAGDDLGSALVAQGHFDDDLVAVIENGEETGRLPEALAHLADDLEERLSLMVKNLGTLIQPLLMIVLGGVVLFIILAVILPYLALLRGL